MVLYDKLSEIENDKIYVCAHYTDAGYKIDEFAIFAYITYTFTDGVMLRRFQKFGKVKYSTVFMNWEDFKFYYKPLNIVKKEEAKK